MTWQLLSLAFLLCLISHPSNAYETVEDAATLARRLVDLSHDSIGTFATVYPSDHPNPTLADQPFSLQEYYASCHQNGSLTILFLPISRHSQNILHSFNHSASLSISSQQPAARKARVSLIGRVTIFQDVVNTPDEDIMAACYLQRHPDARNWLPKSKHQPHIAYWARFDPHTIYFVGGFGDEHYIGYIPLQLYQDAAPPDFTGYRNIAGRILADQTRD